ncbi:MAG: hypothetical protein JWM10_147 [Myxococcaceae bacterium]|nr:hypothetical protein [Myxococcaceae bacterium]
MRAAAVLVVLSGGCAGARARVAGSSAGGDGRVEVTVRNRSRFDVHGLRLRAAARRAWGPERLGSDALRAGQDRAVTLDGCAPRDVALVDARGEVCVLDGVAVCRENDGFTLTTDDLLRCERWR